MGISITRRMLPEVGRPGMSISSHHTFGRSGGTKCGPVGGQLGAGCADAGPAVQREAGAGNPAPCTKDRIFYPLLDVFL